MSCLLLQMIATSSLTGLESISVSYIRRAQPSFRTGRGSPAFRTVTKTAGARNDVLRRAIESIRAVARIASRMAVLAMRQPAVYSIGASVLDLN